jgi:hypothetical protein
MPRILKFDFFCTKILQNSNYKVRTRHRKSELELIVLMYSDGRCILVLFKKWSTQNLKILKDFEYFL